MVNLGEVRPNALSSPPGIFSDLLRFVQIPKREWGAESNGKLPHLFILSKTATLVPEFAIEDLPLGRIAALGPKFTVKDLPLGRTLMMMYCVRAASQIPFNEFWYFPTAL